MLCLLSLSVWAADSDQILARLSVMDQALARAAGKEDALVTDELARMRQQPGYRPQYANPRVVRDYHREAESALASIIALKREALASTLPGSSVCTQAVNRYRAETFDTLQLVYQQFAAREPPFPIVAPVYGANQRDSLGFITQVVMSCFMAQR